MHIYPLTDKKFRTDLLCLFVALLFFGVGCVSVPKDLSEKDKTEKEMFILVEKKNSYMDKGQYDHAIRAYEEAIRLKPEPDDISTSKARRWAQNNLAWLLATCPDDTIRNGDRAVALAE